MTATAATRLDVARARRLTDQLRQALDVAVELLGEAFEGRAWEALGYASWEAYTAAELPQLAILGKGMPVGERVATVAALRGKGMGLRPIASALGLGLATTKRAADAGGVQLATVTSLDGRARPGKTGQENTGRTRPRLTNVARAVLVVREAGDAGVTVHEVTRRLRLSQSATSALLCRLAGDGRLTYRRPAKRGQTGTYVVTGS